MRTAGGRPALLAFGENGVEHWAYSEVSKLVARLARGLDVAVNGQERTVAIFAPSGPQWVIAALSTLAARGTLVPVDTQLTRESLAWVLEDSAPSLIFTNRSGADRLQELGLSRIPRTVLLDAPESDPNSWRRWLDQEPLPITGAAASDVAAVFYTSGTTGRPKGVPLTQRNLTFQIAAIEQAGFIRSGDRVLLPLPLHHVYPFVMGLLAPLGLLLPVVLPRTLTGPQVLRALREGKATLIIGVPRLYRALLAGIEGRLRFRTAVAAFHGLLRLLIAIQRYTGIRLGIFLFGPLRRRVAPNLRLLACGGAPLKPNLGYRLEALGWDITVGYGLTETAPLLTLRLPGIGPLESVGRPIPGVELRLDGAAAPGEARHRGAGEILARGANVFQGYRHLADKTQDAFTEGWFRTGDLGRFDRKGNLLLLGRVSTLIVTEAGKNIQPEEIEEAYDQHPAIAEVGVFEHQGRLAGVVVPDARELRRTHRDMEQIVREAIAAVSAELPSYERLGDIAVTAEPLSRTRLGKIRRHLLADRFNKAKERGPRAEPTSAGPMSVETMRPEDRELLQEPLARQVWDWFAARYPQANLTPDSSPELDLGVDSMEWLNLTLELAQQTGVELHDGDIARADTVRDLLNAILAADRAPQTTISLEALLERPETAVDERERRRVQSAGLWRSAGFGLLARLNQGLVHSFLRVQVFGLERLRSDTQYLFAPNHLSYLDPFVLAAALGVRRLRRTYWGGWTGAAFANPILSAGSRIAQVVPVDPERGVMSSLGLAALVLKSGRNLVWFPEGGRSPDGSLQPFRPGIGMLLNAYHVSVVPVAIRGTREALAPGALVPHPSRVVVEFGEPLSVDQLEDEGEGADPHQVIVSALQHRLRTMLADDR